LPSDSLTHPPSNLPPNSIVDCYLRDSGGEKQDRSVPRQLESIKAYCLKHNLKLRHIYKDVAKSGGTTAGRDQFDSMISSTREEENRPQAILLWNYARFARDLDDSTYYKALLRSKRGIIIHSLTDNIPEGPYAKFVEILIDISNEEKRRQTSIDTKDGLRSLVKQGAVPGIPPRGFKREPIITINPRTGEERKNHRWVPDPKYIHRIQKAFQMRAAGASLNEIQKACKLFTTINSYSTFWKNHLHYGTLIYAGETYEKYCTPIIKKSLWQKVQLIQENFAQSKNIKSGDRNHPRRQTSDFLLSGIARCANCGSPLYGRTSHQKTGHKYQSYLCTLAYRKRGACTKGRIPKPAFETAVINSLVNTILKKEYLDEMHRLLSQQEAGLASEQAQQRREILTQIASNKKQLNNIIDAITENGSSPTLQTRLKSLEHQKQELEFNLKEIEANPITTAPTLTPAQLEQRLKHITTILKSQDLPSQKKILNSLISHIDIKREGNLLKGTIYFFLPLDGEDNSDPEDNDPTPPDTVPSPHHSSGPLKYQKLRNKKVLGTLQALFYLIY